MKAKSPVTTADEFDMSTDDGRSKRHDPEPLPSTFARDSGMRELIELFLQELPERMHTLQTALESGNEQQIRRITHQLKGAAGYGYPSIGETAASVERTIIEEEANLSSIGERVEDLIELCRRAARTDTFNAMGRDGEPEP